MCINKNRKKSPSKQIIMLSIGLKNSILVILIILIIHFIIKNMILDKNGSSRPSIESENSKASYHPPYAPEKFTNDRSNERITNDKVLNISETEICKTKPRDDDALLKKYQEDEMMRFVAMGDSSESKSLDTYFKDISSEVKDKESCIESNVCKFKADNQQLPLSTTCDADVQKLPLVEGKKIRANCDLNQDKKNIMILTEYEDEKDMNGGKLFGVLDAFDNYDLNYQPYQSECAPV